jgi:hypothetical protein
MNSSIIQAATVAAGYIASGQFPCSTSGARAALSRASATCGLVLDAMESAVATAAALRQSSAITH